MKQLPLSLIVITKNEEPRIERCLRSVPFASECLVLDSGSTDGTRETARAAGARVLDEPWRGFGPQKRRATELARFDWVLSLDADEALSPEAAEEIIRRFESLDPETGYRFSRLSFHLGRWIRHGGWFPDRQLRLYHRSHSQWPESLIHERVQSKRSADFEHPILHWVFRDLSHQVQTNDRYSSLQAEERHRRGEKFRFWKLLMKPKVKFWECYLLKRGFLDGLPGLLIAVSAAYSVFLRYAKMWELERQAKENR